MIKLFAMSLPSIVTVLLLLQLLQLPSNVVLSYTRDDFPSDFIFGSGTSAYQVEGASSEDGRTPSILDIVANRSGGKYDGEVACDEYHKYKEDVQLMVRTGLDAYRFSISWSRLIPNGTGPINPKGVEYYNNLINELLKYGIQPHATLLHWDIPLVLKDAYGGWASRKLVNDFTEFADVCFREFGDRVLYWTTIDEPNCCALLSPSAKSLYIAAHNLLLSHASAVELYKRKYQGTQRGFVGFNVCTSWYVPGGDSEEDLNATQRVSDFITGWVIHPLVFGDYPDILKQSLGNRLPSFTKHEIELVKGSFDFIGVNIYTAIVVKDEPGTLGIAAKCHDHMDVQGKYVQGVLENFKRNYGNPPIYIHENGYRTTRNESISTLHDQPRVEYLSDSIGSMLDAVRNGSNVKGYFQWSFLDLLELPGGFKYSFGLYYVDLVNDPDLKRYPKLSAHWYSAFLNGKDSFNLLGRKSASRELLGRETRLFEVEYRNKRTLLKQMKEFHNIFLCLAWS